MTKQRHETIEQRKADPASGYVLITVVMVLSLAGLLISSSMLQTATGLRTVSNTKARSRAFVQAEGSLAHAVSWLRANSQKLVEPFRRDQFYLKFERTSATAGANDPTELEILTTVKLLGTSDSALLTNDPALGAANFPATVDLLTNTAFDAAADFAGANMGQAKVRITLINVVAKDSTKDYGPSPSPLPETDFYPIYRIDAVSELNEGAHVSQTVNGNVVNLLDMGFYGQNYLELRQPCDSYKSSSGPYSNSTKKANCPVGSNSTAAIHKSEQVYGTVKTNGAINGSAPFGGEACADFVSGCPNKGETCTGEDCGVPLLEQYKAWAVYCPTNQGNLDITTNTTLVVTADTPANRCWGTVKIRANATLTLVTNGIPYFFQTLDLVNNTTSVLKADPSPASGRIDLYVQTFTGNKFNGNQSINANGKPTSFTIHYLGTNPLLLNGTADMRLALIAPNAYVTVSGSFEYYGALLAKNLSLTGSGEIHYDEDLGGSGEITDAQYRVASESQLYR